MSGGVFRGKNVLNALPIARSSGLPVASLVPIDTDYKPWLSHARTALLVTSVKTASAHAFDVRKGAFVVSANEVL